MVEKIVNRHELGILENEIASLIENRFGLIPPVNQVLDEDILVGKKLSRFYRELRDLRGVSIPSSFERPTIRRLALYLARETRAYEERIEDEAEIDFRGYGLLPA